MNKFDGCHTIFTSLRPLPRPVRQITKKLCRQIADRGLYPLHISALRFVPIAFNSLFKPDQRLQIKIISPDHIIIRRPVPPDMVGSVL